MIRQKPTKTITGAYITSDSDNGYRIICNSTTAFIITLHSATGRYNFELEIDNIGTGQVTIGGQTLKQYTHAHVGNNGGTAWSVVVGGGSMTKSEIEQVLTGELTSHTHPVSEVVIPQATEIELGGIKAKEKTTETNEVAIDPATGKLYTSGTSENGGSATMNSAFYTNVVELLADSSTFEIGILQFDVNTDKILIYEGGIYQSIPEEITVTSTVATKVSGIWLAGTQFDILVIKQTNTSLAIGNIDGGKPDSTYSESGLNGLLPAGGTTGQIPIKYSDDDYDVSWVDASFDENALTLLKQTSEPTTPNTDYFKLYIRNGKLILKDYNNIETIIANLPIPRTISSLSFDTNFTDLANVDNIWSTFGNAIVSATQSKFGVKSLYLNGVSGTYIRMPITSDFNFTDTDFTIEWWEYRLNTNAGTVTFAIGTSNITSDYAGMLLGLMNGSNYTCLITSGTEGNKWDVTGLGGDAGQSFGTPILNQWVHRAITRQGYVYRVFQDGIQVSNWTYAKSPQYVATHNAMFGVRTSVYANMYIDDFNIIRGYAKYITNFTPSTEPSVLL